MTRLIDKDYLIEEIRCSPVGQLLIRKHNLDGMIEKFPEVDAIPVRHGRWIYLDKDKKFFKKHIVKCSLCNNSLDLYAVNGGRGDANYCPNCGAIMEKPE